MYNTRSLFLFVIYNQHVTSNLFNICAIYYRYCLGWRKSTWQSVGMWLANPTHSVAVPEQAAICNQRFLKDAVSVLDKAIIGHKLYSLLSMLNKITLQK